MMEKILQQKLPVAVLRPNSAQTSMSSKTDFTMQ
jgi:hypothetical protein